MLLLPLDDLLAVTREFLRPQATRSGLDRCFRRHGVGNLNALKPKEPALPHKAFKSHKTAAAAGSFLNALHKACPIKMQKILTDNGKAFTDSLFASPSGQGQARV
jgi:hypothetical protein